MNGGTVSANYVLTVCLNYNANYVAMNGTGQGGKATLSGNLDWSDGYGSSPYGIWGIDLSNGTLLVRMGPQTSSKGSISMTPMWIQGSASIHWVRSI